MLKKSRISGQNTKHPSYGCLTLCLSNSTCVFSYLQITMLPFECLFKIQQAWNIHSWSYSKLCHCSFAVRHQIRRTKTYAIRQRLSRCVQVFPNFPPFLFSYRSTAVDLDESVEAQTQGGPLKSDRDPNRKGLSLKPLIFQGRKR